MGVVQAMGEGAFKFWMLLLKYVVLYSKTNPFLATLQLPITVPRL